MVHMHHSQPLKMKFGTNHFLGSETLVPLQYRVRVNLVGSESGEKSRWFENFAYISQLFVYKTRLWT